MTIENELAALATFGVAPSPITAFTLSLKNLNEATVLLAASPDDAERKRVFTEAAAHLTVGFELLVLCDVIDEEQFNEAYERQADNTIGLDEDFASEDNPHD